ncbi:MAG: L,D-transpeptidase [Blastocatellia bacterium]
MGPTRRTHMAMIIVCLLAIPGLLMAQQPKPVPHPTPAPTVKPGPPAPAPGSLPPVTPPGKSTGELGKKNPEPPLTEADINEARQLLDGLGYWVITDTRGQDVSLRHGLIAFQKITGRRRTGKLTAAELIALRAAHRPRPLETGPAHIEVDLLRQVLFVVDAAGLVQRILPVSTGSGEWFTESERTRQAITPTGRFTIQWQISGWRKSPLGLLYYPNYFFDGVAIHGNPAVPVTPASHGCVRIPMFAAREFSQIAVPGTPVLVHEGNPLARPEPPVAQAADTNPPGASGRISKP